MSPDEKVYPNLDPKQEELLRQKVESMERGDDLTTDMPTGSNVQNDPLITEQDVMRQHGASQRQDPQTFAQPAPQPQGRDLKKEIEEIEMEIGTAPITTPRRGANTFLDGLGNETFYVKNIGGRHVIITDIDGMDKIPAGSAVDLLKFVSLDDLKKSRDLRRYLNSTGTEKELERVTEEEYLDEIRRIRDNKQKIDLMKRQDNRRAAQQQPERDLLPHERPYEPEERPIRPAIVAKLGKLALRYDKDPENVRLAMTSREFITWIQNEPFTHAEIEYIMGDPSVVKDHNIRAALLEKKANTPPNG